MEGFTPTLTEQYSTMLGLFHQYNKEYGGYLLPDLDTPLAMIQSRSGCNLNEVKMKTLSLKLKLAGLLTRLSLVTAISLFALSCTGQSAWDTSEVKGRTTAFKCIQVDDKLNITSNNYGEPRNTRIQYDINKLDFSYVSLISHDPFLEACKESFTASRLTQLAAVNDFVSMIIHVDGKGQALSLSFMLNERTTILPEELEILERELLTRVRFVVIGKEVEDLIFHRVHLRVYFSEVQDGEIRSVRHSVNLKNEY